MTVLEQQGIRHAALAAIERSQLTGATLNYREPYPCSGDILKSKPITEPLLISYMDHGAVTGITIKETDEGFKVLVSVTFDDQAVYELQTQRSNKPKLWSSLNRLVQQLGRYPSLPPIKLEVRTTKRETVKAKKRAPKKA